MTLRANIKDQVRRHLAYPAVGFATQTTGGGSTGASQSYLFSDEFYFTLEVRMNQLTPYGESTLTGNPYGSIIFQGSGPNPGDTVTATLSGGNLNAPHSVTATAQAGDGTSQLATRLATQCLQDTTLSAAGIEALALYPPESEVDNPQVEVAFVSPKVFTLTVTSTGVVGASVPFDSNGGLPDLVVPTVKVAGVQQTVAGYLPILNFLEGQIVTATSRLGTSQAETFKTRKDEVQARDALYVMWVRKMATFIGVPINQNQKGGNQEYGNIRI